MNYATQSTENIYFFFVLQSGVGKTGYIFRISKSYANMVPTFTTIFLFVSKRAGKTSAKGRFCPDFVPVIFRLSSVFVPYLSARLVHDFKTWSYKGTFDGFFGNNIHSSSGII